VNFRGQSAGLIRERGRLLTAAVLASQFAVFFLVLFCVRAAGIQDVLLSHHGPFGK
jgi:hypothetical protein